MLGPYSTAGAIPDYVAAIKQRKTWADIRAARGSDFLMNEDGVNVIDRVMLAEGEGMPGTRASPASRLKSDRV